ncbi:uncharacterized protein LTR77_007753 [Saxophila tyrrhenica]|uniref:Cupin 2 conserved barrel domain-containing protein n=1 Tax=Saxophila tyrrhenica TaxID=1690608 RepID=A0AAV9P2Z5_9PEZI|nr:hypothetical protein LTR77_007753 [Saxophila tyrrhenica]
MPSYKATHIPYGLTDPSKRTIVNPGIKDEVEFLEYGIETGGSHFTARALVKPDGGVPIHRHYGYGETFMTQQGILGAVGHNGTKPMLLNPENKETYRVQPGEWHRFFNPSKTESIVFDGKVEPAHQRFEINLHIFYGLVNDGHGTPEGFPDLWHLLMLTSMAEIGYQGFGGWVMGMVAGVVGFIARVTGEEERLTVKYYGRPITDEEKRKWKVE